LGFQYCRDNALKDDFVSMTNPPAVDDATIIELSAIIPLMTQRFGQEAQEVITKFCYGSAIQSASVAARLEEMKAAVKGSRI
jgi:hypothetical protein